MEEIEVLSCIRGYHVYKDVWTAAVGETLVCQREPENAIDIYIYSSKKFSYIKFETKFIYQRKKGKLR